MRFGGTSHLENWSKLSQKQALTFYDPDNKSVQVFFFSGGIRFLATVLTNRANYPIEHPGSIKDGLLVCGLEVADPAAFHHVVSSVSLLARDADITLIPVYTNMRFLGPEDDLDFGGPSG